MSTDARGLTVLLGLASLFFIPAPAARAGLDDYVRANDAAFSWTLLREEKTPDGVAYHINLTSQEWHGIRWVHHLQIFEPAELKYPDSVLLFVTGGSIKNLERDDSEMGTALARLCGARVAVLPQVPNQPLLGDKTEDTLIAETFVRYLETKDESWPLLFPMVKSAVKAMDAVQQWADREKKPAVKRFVVTGASKRGWTTWLTGATDPRVVAIAPMVIDTLNMKAQKDHALEVWGKTSEQIDDYTSRGLTEKFDDPVGEHLWRMVDPYSYRARLTIPKLLINGTNDRYWTLDALNIYWDELKGPKSVVYLPNAGHNLAANRSYALNGIGAFFRHNVGDRPWPVLSWKHGDDRDGRLTLSVDSSIDPKSARLWVARSESRDFRESAWSDTPMTLDGKTAAGSVARPATGYVALLGDLEYAVDGIPYHLSTQIRQTGAKPKE